MKRHFRGYQGGLFLCFSESVSFSSGLSGMSLKEEQLSAIKAVYEGCNVFVCLPAGYGKSKLCRLLWNTNLVEIELSSLCLPWSL